MRSEGSDSSKANCEDALIKLACATDSDDCPAECREDSKTDEDGNVIKSGDLEVSASESAGRKILANGTSEMDTLKFKSSEDVEISKIVLERYGYSSNDSVASVRLENEDGVVISNEVDGLNTKGQANLTIKKDYRNVDGVLNATVIIKAKSKAGETIGFKVVDVNSSAKNLNIDSYKPYTYDVVEYSGAYVDFTVRNTEKTHNIEAGKLYEISKFRIKAPADSSILVKGFTLTNSGSVSLDKFAEDVEVSVAGEVKKATWSMNKKDNELVIAFKDDVELEAKANAEIIVKASFTEDFDEYDNYIQLYLNESADFSAIDSKTESRVTVDPDVLGDTNATSWPVYKIAGGKVKLTNTKLGNIDASQNSVDVVIAEGKITVPETIKGTLTVNVIGEDVSGTGSQYAIEAMRLVVGGDEYDGKKPSNYSAATADSTFTFSNVEIDRDSKVQFIIDVRDTDLFSGKTISFNIAGKGWSDFYYTEGKVSNKIDVAGSISFSKVTIQAARASLTNTLSKAAEFKNGEQTDRQIVFEGVYTAKKGDVKLNTWTLSGNSVSTATGTVNFYLLVNGEEVADATYEAKEGTTWKYTNTFSDVEIAAEKTAKIVVEADINTKGTGSVGKFMLTLEGEDTNGNKAGKAQKSTVELKIVDKGSASVDASSSKKTVLRTASNVKIAEFVIKPANDASEVEIDDFSFIVKAGNNVLGPDAITVSIDDKTEDAINTSDTKYEPTNLKAKSAGVTVKVELNDETYGIVTLNNLKVNGKNVSSTFTKRFEEAVVSISSIKDLGGTTEFKLKVDAESDLTIKNLVVTFDDNGTAVINDEVSNGDTFEAKGKSNDVRLVTNIKYDVFGSTKPGINNKSTTADACYGGTANTTVKVAGVVAEGTVIFSGDKLATPSTDDKTATAKAPVAGAAGNKDITLDGNGTSDLNALCTANSDCGSMTAGGALILDNGESITITLAGGVTEVLCTQSDIDSAVDAQGYYEVSIDKDTYTDFFKVGDNGYARAYQSNK